MENTQLNAGTSREKYWSEVDDAERIKRTRKEVKMLHRRVAELSKTVAFLVQRSEQHEHGSNGKPMMPVEQRYGSDDEGPRHTQVGDDCFF